MTRVDFVDDGASLDKRTGQGAHVVLYKRAAGAGGDGMKTDVKTLPEDVQVHLAALVERAVKAEARAVEVEKGVKPPEEDPWKGVSPALKARFEAQQAETAEAKRLAAEERDLRKQSEYVAKARAFRGLPVNPDDDWKVLKAVDERLAPEEAKRLRELLAAGDAALVAAGAFRAAGFTGDTGAADAQSRLDTMAGELAKAQKLTPEQGLARAMRTPEGRRLYDEIKAERRARGGA